MQTGRIVIYTGVKEITSENVISDMLSPILSFILNYYFGFDFDLLFMIWFIGINTKTTINLLC